jgi:hypothetical protein
MYPENTIDGLLCVMLVDLVMMFVCQYLGAKQEAEQSDDPGR